MQAIRDWQASRQWQQIRARTARRPATPMRWSTDARVLCLLREDDQAASRVIHRLGWSSLGIDANDGSGKGPGAAFQPELLVWSDLPDKTPERAHEKWTPAQLNFAGLLQPEVAKVWQEREYDFLVNFLPKGFAPVDHFFAGAQAHLRIAMHEDCMEAYDLVLRPTVGAQVEGFAAELARYLYILNPRHAR